MAHETASGDITSTTNTGSIVERNSRRARDTSEGPITAGRSNQQPGSGSAVAASAPLLATKFYAPRTGGHLLSRPRLVERLTMSVRGPLTLIAAPAGWGKTTVLSEWRASPAGLAWPIGWVSLDDGDNDPVRFWTYALAALNQAHPGVADAPLALLRTSQPPALDTALTLLLNALADLPTDIVLVLDDYHLITAEPVHTALASLLDHLPPRLHLVLAAREDPRLPLTRLRLRGDLAELRTADLRFTPEEAANFLTETVGLSLSPKAAEALEVRSEGWIAGLQLAALAALGRSADQIEDFVHHFSGSHRYIVDYLIEEVLGRQSAEVQDFLLRSAVLDRFCAPLCATLLVDSPSMPPEAALAAHREPSPGASVDSIGHAQELLEHVERANLFLIPLDDDREWYRYHHLFADVLRSRLWHLHPGLAAELHRRASAWFEERGFVVEAVEHALAAPDSERAAELVALHGIAMGVAGSFATVLGWLQKLPSSAARQWPRLAVCHALMLFETNQLEAVEGYLRDAEAAANASIEAVEAADETANELAEDVVDRTREEIHANISPSEARTILGMVATLRGEIAAARGDMAGSVRLERQALTLLPESEPLWRDTETRSQARAFHVTGDVTPGAERALMDVLAPLWAKGNVITGLGASSDLAYMHALQGRLGDTIAVLTDATRRVSEALGPENRVTGSSYFVGVGDVLRERNALDAAEHSLLQSIDLMPKAVIVSARVVALGYVALAKVHQARGRYAAALTTLDTFAQVAQERHFVPDACTPIAAVRAQLQLAHGDLDAAARWADTAGLSGDDAKLPFSREREYLTLARVHIAQGRTTTTGPRLEEALCLLDRLECQAKPNGRRSSMLEIQILRALALQAQGRQPAALAALAGALLLAEPEGYVRLFADEGAPMAALLVRLLTAIRVGRLAATETTTAYVRRLLTACGSHGASPTDGAPSSDLSDLLSGAHLSALDLEPLSAPAAGSTSTSAGTQPGVAPLVTPLTEREVEVLHLLAVGAANADIARLLVLSIGTVKKHVYNICTKLNVRSRSQAVARARALRLL